MEKIKLIDLLNKIANANNIEEIPKKIKYGSFIYERFENLEGIYNYKNCDGEYFEDVWFVTNILNNEVEIIEEPRNIEVCGSLFTKSEYDKLAHSEEEKKIEKLGAFNIKKFYDDYPETAQFILAMFNKQEELIDKVNGEDNE